MEFRVLYILVFAALLSVANGIIQSETFIFSSEARDKTCPLPDQLFTLTTNRKIACVQACLRWSGCAGVAYHPMEGWCTGCSGLYDLFSPMIETPGTIFYVVAPEIVDCGVPTVSDAHVLLGTFDGNSSVGAQVAYNCTPCTYFPSVEDSVITCQENGTWSIPVCLFGPDVGYLANNVTIPAGEIGCGVYYGNTCEGTGLSGDMLRYNGNRGNCFCDTECCYSDDCCFDSTCNDEQPSE